MIPELLLAWIVGFSVTVVIGMIFWCVYSVAGPQFIKCDCGNKCRVSEDGWFYWECERCGRSGKAKPF